VIKMEEHYFANGTVFVPTEEEKVMGWIPNPKEWESWGKPTFVRLFVGLKAGRNTEYFDKGDRILLDTIYGAVWKVRVSQVGKKYGSSFIKQVGHYIDPEKPMPKREKEAREDSMQIIIYPSDMETWEEFQENISELVDEFLEVLAQNSVIVEWTKNGRVVDSGEWVWKK